MQALRSLVVAVVAFVVLAVPSVVLADGRVALVAGNSTYAHIGRLPNPDNDARDTAAALRRLGFEVTTELDADRVELTEALRAFTRQSAGADVSLVFLRGPRHRDGRRQLPGAGGRAARARRGRALRDGDGRRPAGIDVGRLVAAGAPGCVAEQPAGAVDAADGSDPYGERRQLRRPERGPAGGRDAGGVCGGGGNGGGRTGPEQPVHGGAAVASGDAAGGRADVPPSPGGSAGVDERGPAASRVPLAGRRADVGHGERGGCSRSGAGRRPTSPSCPSLPIAALRELAEAGDAKAQTELGERYEEGRGIGRDYGVAVSWFRRAADQGHTPGQVALGYMYSTGRGVGDDVVAVSWHRRAAEQGNVRGQHNLGVM